MKKLFLTGLYTLGAVFQLHGTAIAKSIPIEQLVARPDISGLNLSSDGNYFVALIAPSKTSKSEKQSIAVWDANDLSKPPVINQPDGTTEFLGIRALKAGKILVYVRKPWQGNISYCGEGKQNGLTKTFIRKTFITDTSFSKFEEPFGAATSKMTLKSGRKNEIDKLCQALSASSRLIDILPADPENIVISKRSKDARNVEYHRYNLMTGQSERLFKQSGSKRYGIIDGPAALVLTKHDDEDQNGEHVFKTYIRTHGTDKFEEQKKLMWDTATRHSVNIVGYDKDFSTYYISTDQFSDKARVYDYDPVAQTFSPSPRFENEAFNVTDIIQSSREEDYGTILGYTLGDATHSTVWLDPYLAKIQAQFKKTFPGKNVDITDYNYDRNKLLVMVSSTGLAPSYYLMNNGKANFLGSARGWTKASGLQDTKLIYYTARDGLEIPGLLTMPIGWEKGDKPVPTIIHPHGGPWARDYAGWDSSNWIPFFTSRGFAVLQPQYRGSNGWGHKLWLAGDKQWGLKMQDDKDDGVAWLVKEGISDPDKMVIMGYSYGGFAAMAASVRPNSPYRCAIAGAGVAELDKLGATWGINRIQRLLQGNTVEGMDPIQNTSTANIPILLFHGDRDQRVPLYHSKNFYNKVKKKVPAKLVVIKDQKHQLPWSPENQRKSLKAMDAFLKKQCGFKYD
ncbi:MAG: S9 family peptidase [Robiginitomaculum sp.]|nr:MAG: S9 family peptidase [Robiginitomaculum sp.]